MKASLLATILFSTLLVGSLHAADAAKPAVDYVGAVSINPCQDPKVLADWYAKLGIETSLMGGGYYGMFKSAGGPFFFGIHPKKKDAPKMSSASVEFVLHVPDYESWMATVHKNGLEPAKVEQDATGRFAEFKDPDGNDVTIWGK